MSIKSSEQMGDTAKDRRAVYDIYAYQESYKNYNDLNNVIDSAVDKRVTETIIRMLKKADHTKRNHCFEFSNHLYQTKEKGSIKKMCSDHHSE